MLEKGICPGCGRRCSLSEPYCERGEEYLRTGKLPERKQGEGHHHEKRMEHYQNASMDDKLIINLRDISHMMHRQYEGKASQKRILIILQESGALTQKSLTERLGIQPGSASEILSKLEHAGLIARTPNETDRRTTDIQLTDAGAELAAQAFEQRQVRHQEMFDCLSSEEQETLLSLLEKIRRDWEIRFPGRHAHGRHHGKHDSPDHHGRIHQDGHRHHEQ